MTRYERQLYYAEMAFEGREMHEALMHSIPPDENPNVYRFEAWEKLMWFQLFVAESLGDENPERSL